MQIGRKLKHLNNLFSFPKTWGSPYINRFLQPDTLIPGVDSPQSWNRFSYVSNNPIKLTDPTGHKCIGDDENCEVGEGGTGPTPPIPPVNNSGGGTCTKCHSDNSPPSVPQDSYSDWYSGQYSGCFMCHAAQSYNQTTLTNLQLADYNDTLYYYGGYYGMAMLGGAAIGTGLGLSLPATVTTAEACASNAVCKNEVSTAITTYYPPNRGFFGEATELILEKGDYIGRRGDEFGRYFSPVGTPAWELSLQPGMENLPENVFQVTKSFPVYAGTAAPWFGQPGGGVQYFSLLNQAWLVENGFITPVH